MGKRAIERGSQDTWTPSPTRLQQRSRSKARSAAAVAAAAGTRCDELWAELRKPELRDPRGYIIPADQPDFLDRDQVHQRAARGRTSPCSARRATFGVGGKTYPAGSFVVMTAQAFRPHVIDMFEPQDHPNVIPYPGAPPTPPYDNAGWTLAYQMGVAVRSRSSSRSSGRSRPSPSGTSRRRPAG